MLKERVLLVGVPPLERIANNKDLIKPDAVICYQPNSSIDDPKDALDPSHSLFLIIDDLTPGTQGELSFRTELEIKVGFF
jgi:hypothetical protein